MVSLRAIVHLRTAGENVSALARIAVDLNQTCYFRSIVAFPRHDLDSGQYWPAGRPQFAELLLA
jgi:hypothetical protein